MSSEPCSCDEAKAWRKRALESERIIMRMRAALRRSHPDLLLVLEEIFKPSEDHA